MVLDEFTFFDFDNTPFTNDYLINNEGTALIIQVTSQREGTVLEQDNNYI